MDPVAIVGVDPGLANLGLCEVVVDQDVSLGSYRAVKTKPAPKKRRPYAHDDLMRRWFELHTAFLEFIAGLDHDVVAVVLESVSWVRNSSTMAGIGGTYGLLIGHARFRGWPVLQVRPQELKQHLTDGANTNKGAVFDGLQERMGYPPVMDENDFCTSDHVVDAAAVAITALDTSEILRAALKARGVL